LTRAQLGVLYYIETSDPFGDRGLGVTVTEIGQELGLDKSSVSRALKSLDQMGYINLEIIRATVKVLRPRNIVASTQQALHPRNLQCVDATDVAPTQQTLHPRNNRSRKAKQDNSSSSSQTINTFSNFIDSLSISQREKFLEFGLKKAAALPKPPELPHKWIEKHYLEIYEQFKKTPEGKKFTTEQDWANHPHRDEWIEQIRQGRPRFIAQGGPAQERETRRQFADWAEANHLIWEVQS
jgi:hypothetical protein